MAMATKCDPVPDPAIILALRKVVSERKAANIGGELVDTMTAQSILQVYDRLKPEGKSKMASLPVQKMIRRAYAAIDK